VDNRTGHGRLSPGDAVTAALLVELAQALGEVPIASDSNHGHHLTVGDSDVFLYGGDETQLLLVLPVGLLPVKPSYALTAALLHNNMFDSEWAPFVLATDAHSMILLWGRLQLADLDGQKLGAILETLAGRVAELRTELGRPAP
jgi:hypothetical protein